MSLLGDDAPMATDAGVGGIPTRSAEDGFDDLKEVHDRLEGALRMRQHLITLRSDAAAQQLRKLDREIADLKQLYRELEGQPAQVAPKPLVQVSHAPAGLQTEDAPATKRIRKFNVDEEEQDTADADADDETSFQTSLPGQNVVVYNIAHTDLLPRCDEPAIRIGGLFSGREEAIQFVRQIYPHSQTCHWAITPAQQAFLVTNSLERLGNGAYVQAHLAAIEANAKKRVQHRDRDFQETTSAAPDKRSVGKTSLNAAKPGASSFAGPASSESMLADPTPTAKVEELPSNASEIPFPRDFVDLRQQFSVVSFELDHDDDFVSREAGIQRVAPDTQELSFTVYAAFDTEKRARRYLRSCLGKIHPTRTFYIVDTYRWLRPFEAESKRDLITEQYENEELNKIMKQRKMEKQRIEAFKQNSLEQGLTPAETIIARDGTVAATDMHGQPIAPVLSVSEQGQVLKRVEGVVHLNQGSTEPVSLLTTSNAGL